MSVAVVVDSMKGKGTNSIQLSPGDNFHDCESNRNRGDVSCADEAARSSSCHRSSANLNMVSVVTIQETVISAQFGGGDAFHLSSSFFADDMNDLQHRGSHDYWVLSASCEVRDCSYDDGSEHDILYSALTHLARVLRMDTCTCRGRSSLSPHLHGLVHGEHCLEAAGELTGQYDVVEKRNSADDLIATA